MIGSSRGDEDHHRKSIMIQQLSQQLVHKAPQHIIEINASTMMIITITIVMIIRG
jgi:hypothetical protein